jgi:lipopolysaccharide transport system ATP-binding protein
LDGEVDVVIEHYLRSVQAVTGEALDHRHDRKGDGRLRVSHVDVRGPGGGPARTGSDCEIRFAYSASALGGEVTISAAVEGPLGEPVFFAANRVTGDSLMAAAGGELVCSLPELPLLPGRYALTFYIEVNGILADWVRNAMHFEVFEDDVFGTGRLPPTSHGPVLVRHTWAVDAGMRDAHP